MPKTKSLSRLTALLLCFGLLAGCSRQAQPSNSGQGAESPSASQSAESPSAAPDDPLEVLRAIPYYGDPEKCAMTAGQALAYARLLADGLAGKVSDTSYAPVESGSAFWDAPYTAMSHAGEYQTDRANVILGDFAGDGQAYLCVVSSEHPDCCFDVFYADGETARFVYGAETYGNRVYTSFCLDENGKMYLTTSGPVDAANHFTRRLELSGTTTQVLHSRDEAYDQEAGTVLVTDDGTETTYTIDEWSSGTVSRDWEELPNAAFTPIPLRDMIGLLNQYAAALGSSESVTVGERTDRAQAALAMLAAMETALSDGSGGLKGDARVIDLNGDGIEELVTCNGSQAQLFYWQEGDGEEEEKTKELLVRDIGWVMGSQTEWWLCKDTETDELGIEWRVSSIDGLSGGSTFVYFSHESTVNETRDSSDGPASYIIDGEEASQEEFDAFRARNQRVEELVSQNSSAQRVEEARAALEAAL